MDCNRQSQYNLHEIFEVSGKALIYFIRLLKIQILLQFDGMLATRFNRCKHRVKSAKRETGRYIILIRNTYLAFFISKNNCQYKSRFTKYPP